MKFIRIALIGFQGFLVVIGLIVMISNIIDTSKLGLPPAAYDQRIFLAHLLNAVQALVLFVAAIAMHTLISRIHIKGEHE